MKIFKLLILTLILILSSCYNTIYCENVEELKTPLRVVSLGSSDWEFNTVLVIDDKGNLHTLQGGCFQSLKVGDTIK